MSAGRGVRRLLAGAALAAVASALASQGSAPAGTAARIVEVGWWTSSPVRPNPPPGGIAVGRAPHGETSRAAVRIDLGDGVGNATLRLEQTGGFGTDLASVRACLGGDNWVPAQGGPLAQAPTDQCARLDRIAQRTGSTWELNIITFVENRTGLVTVVLVPGAGAVSTLGTGYQLEFRAPLLESAPVPTPPTPTSTIPSAAPSAPPSPPGPAFVPPPPPGAGFALPSSTFSPPPADFSALAGEPSYPTPEAEGTAAPPAARDARFADPSLISDDERVPWGRAGLFVLASVAIGVTAGFGRRWAVAHDRWPGA